MITTTLTTRSLILLAAVTLAAYSSAQTPALDPVTALEQAVQLADIQNDPKGAKAFLEKLAGPEIPAKIRDQAKARLAKMNPTIDLNLGPGVKAFEGEIEYEKGKIKDLFVKKTDPPGQDNGDGPSYTIFGQVKRQGKYPLIGEMTLADAIQAAGGLSAMANGTHGKLVRREGDTSKFLVVDFTNDGATPLKPGDSVIVPESLPAAPATERLEEAMDLLMTSGANDRSVLVDAAIDGMAKSLSRRGEYLSKNQEAEFNRVMKNNLIGIGALLGREETAFVIKGIVKNGPAEKSGLVVGSEIMEVDGKTPFGLGGTLENLVAAIRGPSDTRVNLSLKEPDGKLRKVELERRTIELDEPNVRQIGAPSSLFVHHVKAEQPVSKKDIEAANSWWVDEASGIAGVRLSAIPTAVAEELRKVLAAPVFKDKPARGLIIDLRDNGGGSLEEAVGIVDLFVNDGVVVSVKSRDKTEMKAATPSEMLAGVPIVVLINEGTASGAEVIAAALQDFHRATVIGRRSLGVAEVMTLKHLKSGGSMKLPLSELLRPSGKGLDRQIGMTESDAWGVTPDVVVPGVGGRLPASTEITQDWQNMVNAALTHFKSLNAKK